MVLIIHMWDLHSHPLLRGPGTPFKISQGFSPCLSNVQGLPVSSSITVMPVCGHGSCPLIRTLTRGWSSCLDSDVCYCEATCQLWLCLTLVAITGSDPGLWLTSQLHIGPASSLQACLMIWTLAWPWLPSLSCLGAVAMGPWLVRPLPCQLWYLPWFLAPGP